MKKEHRILLLIDAIVNVVLGIALLLFPVGLLSLLGMPPMETNFYVLILGAVILGIGVALLIELFGNETGIRGLGLGGAIALNLCGAGALAIWLITTQVTLPIRGRIILWSVAILILVIAAAELIITSPKSE